MEALAAAITRAASACVGTSCWEQDRRRDRHARLAIRRMHGQSQAVLTDLAVRNRRLDPDPHLLREVDQDVLIDSDLVGDFHRFVIASLRDWADDAAREIDALSGEALAERRRALLDLRHEIKAICAEIEARERSRPN